MEKKEKIPGLSQLITLKEAAEISGYSADYLGQLIRAGKIPGKQVYCNIQWMTTAVAVMSYKNKGQAGGCQNPAIRKWQRFKMEIEALSLFCQVFKYTLPLMLAAIFFLILAGGFLFKALAVPAVSSEAAAEASIDLAF